MELRDYAILVGWAVLVGGAYLALDRRVTRLEDLTRRVESIEKAFAKMAEQAASTSTDMATLTAELEAVGQRVLKLEGTVQDGIAQVLTAIRARPSA